jgi:predicted nucleic acid-binding protein
MPLDLPDGSACFIDANIVYYHFVEVQPFSNACTALLKRVASGQVVGYASAHVISEALHKIMLAEAAAKFGLNRAGLVNWLQRHQDRIGELSEFRLAAHEFAEMGISLLPMDITLFDEAAAQSAQYGLLTNDALVVALVQRHGLVNLVTNDDDFDRLSGLSIWKPR